MSRRLLIGTVVALAVLIDIPSAHASPLRLSEQSSPAPKESARVATLRARANAGDAVSQLNLGWRHAIGQGVPQDFVQAAMWYRKAAEQGNAQAQFNLGLAYAKGQGVQVDPVQAASWNRKAAEQGFASAQSFLGLQYAHGQGVPQDFVQAVAWYRKAAEQGFALGQFNLGLQFATGEGVPQDVVSAFMWINLAASRASGDDQKQWTEARDAVSTVMTPAQIADAQKRSREWLVAFQKRGGK